ncbi:L-serine ammonia-lyase [Corynebacterium epidermidicanis]|uniref:L-serine dehydratase n=1 Tax=Corynebacterium epidermidicanis TaxID=1050174 RepID=A0A0G3GQ30_9CORY|nr:L-serine ammonia-lyase [Corynebacterium epidermidicanis]AKK03264.1 L-serine dehydratase, iron-sulfur-dependent, single chain form [Corynebacterium epidermidicanis]
MTISAIDLFSIGIGPSSSHTVGPMRAARRYILEHPTKKLHVELRGSLAATGKGHGTDRAVVLGLLGYEPHNVDPQAEPAPGADIPTHSTLENGIELEIIFDSKALPQHPNGMIFRDTTPGEPANEVQFFSVGGGFILSAEELAEQEKDGGLGSGAATTKRGDDVPYYFTTGARLISLCHKYDKSVSEIMLANEIALHDEAKINEHLDNVWHTMKECAENGIKTTGILPGGLNVARRAPHIYQHLMDHKSLQEGDALRAMEWVNLYALAVNEENAAGGRVVTAPTNGAAGIIPAVLHYCRDFVEGFDDAQARKFLLAAAAVGVIIKENASISGAEVGCQGEVGSAASMAAAGLCEVLGGTPEQVANAAEIALEHNLGLTCDPVAGLVQIPCIERNAIAAVQAINSARLARLGTGIHHVSLDDCVRTMAATGRDMLDKYKETSTGGLAVNIGLPMNHTFC